MKHFFLAFLLSGTTIAVSAQVCDQHARSVSAGCFAGNFTALNDHLLQLGTSRGFNPYFMTLGATLVVPTGGRYGDHKGIVDAGMILPQQLKGGDSLTFRMQGFYILTSLVAYDVLRDNANLALEFAPGVHWGGLYIREKTSGNSDRYRNPFIAPLARAEFRVVVKPIAFGIRALYRYDITSPRWKDGNGDSALAKSRISGLGLQVYLGWGETY
jgi:hypothetical protein